MSERETLGFEVPELPIDTVAPGTTLLVTGPRRLTTPVTERILLEGRGQGEGSILVSTNSTGRTFVRTCETQFPDLSPETVGFVDATGRADIDVETRMQLRSVSGTGDLTGISIALSILHSDLSARGLRNIRSGFVSLSILLLYTNAKTITRFVHTVGGRIRATDGLGVFVLDPSMHEQSVIHMLDHVCDGHVRVDFRDGETCLRVEGLGDLPSDWVAVDS